MRFRTMRSIVALSREPLDLHHEAHAHPELCISMTDGWLAARRPASLKGINCNNSRAVIPRGSFEIRAGGMELGDGFRVARWWAFPVTFCEAAF
jgi:hypothetical protein